MPGKAGASVPGPFGGGRGSCRAAQREPGPAGSCVPTWAGTRGDRLLCPWESPGPSSFTQGGAAKGGFLQRAFINTGVFSTYCGAKSGARLPGDCLFTLLVWQSRSICAEGCFVTPAVI